MSNVTTSILPEDYLEKRIARRMNLVCISLFFVVMAGVVAVFFVTDRQRDEVLEMQQRVNERYRTADAQIGQLADYRKQQDVMIRRAKITAALNERVPRTLILSELINLMPTELSLTDLTLETEIERATPAPRTGLQRAQNNAAAGAAASAVAADPLAIILPKSIVNLELVGLAPNDTQVSDYMRALRENNLFNEVNLTFTEGVVVDEIELREFQLTMTLNQTIDLTTIEPSKAGELDQDPMSDEVQFRGGEAVRG